MKRRYALRFTPALVEQPIVSKLARIYDVDINILNADVASGRGGKLIVELSGTEKDLDASAIYLSEIGVRASEMVKELLFKQDGCIDCGSCTAVCSAGALSMNKEAKLSFDVSLCVVCGLCVHACPMRLFEVSHEREA